MKVLTEAALRTEFKSKLPDKYIVDKDVIITPLARQYLREKKVEVIAKEDKDKKNLQKNENKYEEKEICTDKVNPKYISCCGGALEKKPEYMTQLHKNVLVYKDDPRIVFRGKLDSLQSKILEIQVLAHSKKISGLVKELDEVLGFTRIILKSEVLNQAFKYDKLIGLSEDKLRKMSHNPKKYFCIDHILPSFEMGEILVRLNSLRSSVREVEIAAATAFRRDFEISRTDIIEGLNRLSSCVYIMMCKYVAGLYK